jgi:hypothetical protein
MKNLVSACLVGILLFPVVTKSQFLPPGLPLPDNSGEDVMPDHLVVGSTIHLVWASNVDHTGTAGTDPDIFYIRYDGSTWSAPVLVNSYGALDNATGHDERLPRLARGPDGTLHCVWQSRYPLQGGTDWDVMYASLVDSNWSTVQALTGAPLDEVLPTVITRQNGDPVVVWQNSLGELHYRVRVANTWSADQRLFTPPLGLTGSDSGPVALARAADGRIVAVWSTTRDISGTMGTDADIVFSMLPLNAPWMSPVPISDHAYGDSGADINPAVVLLNEGTDLEIHVVWESTSDLVGNGNEGDLLGAVYRFPADVPSANPTDLVNSNGIGDQYGDHLPSLCVEPGGVVHVAWQTKDAFVGDLDVLHAHNATPGGLWSHFDLLGQNGYFDGPGENDSLPDIECSTLGVLSGVWQSTDDLGGWLSGGDHELFHALGFGLEVSRPEPINPEADFDTGDEGFGISLVVDDWGVIHAVFRSNEPSFGGYSGPNTDIFYTRNDGTGWSQPELVSDFGAGAGDPYNWAPLLAVDSQQRIHVIWSSKYNLGGIAGTDGDVMYAVRDGVVWSPPELVNSSAIGAPMDDFVWDFKIAPDGTPHAIWGDDDTTSSRLSWSKRTGTGWVAEEQFDAPVNPSGLSHVYGASLWVDAQGAPHICWTSDAEYLGSGPDFDVLYSTRGEDSWTTPVYVNDAWKSDVADEEECRLIGLADGGLLAVITSTLDRDGAGAADFDLFASRKSAAGWQPMELLLAAARNDSNNEFRPQVDIRNNLLVVAWITQEPIGGWGGYDQDSAFAAVDLSAPLPSLAPLRWVNTTALGDDALPLSSSADIVTSVSISLNGRVYFAWGSTLDRLGTGQSDWDAYYSWVEMPIPLLFTDGLE